MYFFGLLVELALVALRQQLRVARDHPQRLLQVVRGDVGELLQLPVRALQIGVRPAQRLLRAHALRDVQAGADQLCGTPLFIHDKFAPGLDLATAAVREHDPILRLIGDAAGQRLLHLAPHVLAVFGVEQGVEIRVRREPLRGCAEEAVKFGGPADHVAHGIPLPAAEMGHGLRGGEMLADLADLQGPLLHQPLEVFPVQPQFGVGRGELAIASLQFVEHGVEGAREVADLVAGPAAGAVAELAGRDRRDPAVQRGQRPDQRLVQREDEAADSQPGREHQGQDHRALTHVCLVHVAVGERVQADDVGRHLVHRDLQEGAERPALLPLQPPGCAARGGGRHPLEEGPHPLDTLLDTGDYGRPLGLRERAAAQACQQVLLDPEPLLLHPRRGLEKIVDGQVGKGVDLLQQRGDLLPLGFRCGEAPAARAQHERNGENHRDCGDCGQPEAGADPHRALRKPMIVTAAGLTASIGPARTRAR